MIYPRWFARLLALLFRKFWQECPSCKCSFAGFETGYIMMLSQSGECMCVCRKNKCQDAAIAQMEETIRENLSKKDNNV